MSSMRTFGRWTIWATAGLLTGTRGANAPVGADFPLILVGAAVSNIGISFLWPLTAVGPRPRFAGGS